ncbi:MAG: RimK family alpha-L-glutamate ligase [Hyphomonadaceae bacterium]
MSQTRVAYLTGRAFRGQPVPAGALPGYEADDFALAEAAAKRAGIQFEPAYWDAPDLARRGFAAAIIRSCWDYTGQAPRFIDTLAAREAEGLRIFNSSAVVRWNARKTYLRTLAAAGTATIPTEWTEKTSVQDVARAFETFDAAELVLKPQVGAGSQATLRLKRNAWSASELALGPQGPAMLQPYLPAIESEGEISLLYFGGALSFVIRKSPVPGGWFANDLKARFEAIAPPEGAEAIAEAALKAAPADLLYARVDLVRGEDGAFRLIELELIEPYLFLALAPAGADDFARALTGALARLASA